MKRPSVGSCVVQGEPYTEGSLFPQELYVIAVGQTEGERKETFPTDLNKDVLV